MFRLKDFTEQGLFPEQYRMHLVEDDVCGNKYTEALQQIPNDVNERSFHVDVGRIITRRYRHHFFIVC